MSVGWTPRGVSAKYSTRNRIENFARTLVVITSILIVSSQPPQEMTNLTPRQTISDRARDIALYDVQQETR